MIGTIGGYIGLFLGYSILQIPDFLTNMVLKYNKRRAKRQQIMKIEPLPMKNDQSSKFSIKDLVIDPDISNEEFITTFKSFVINENNLFE